MAEDKATSPAPQASAARANEASTLPERPKPVTAEDLGLEVEEAPKPKEGEAVFEPYAPRHGFVADRTGRHHEVEDVDAFTQAYPGSKELKQGQVSKAKMGYAAPKVEGADAGQPEA